MHAGCGFSTTGEDAMTADRVSRRGECLRDLL